MDFSIIIDSLPLYGEGLWMTLKLVSVSLAFGLVFGMLLAVLQNSKWAILRLPVFGFSFVFRGTPLLVQLFLFYNGMAQIGFVRDGPLWAVFQDAYYVALIVFSLNTSAYTCEIFRGALANIHRGQIAAAIACGMSPLKILYRIEIPLAFRQGLSSYGNEVIFMLHGSSLASTITLMDLTGAARMVNSRYYSPAEAFLVAGLIYLGLTFVLIKAFRMMERRLLVTT